MFAAYCPRFPSFLVFFLLCRIWGKKISHEIILVGSIAIKSPFLLVKLYHYMWRSCGNLPHIVMIQPLLNTVSVSKYSIDDFLLRTRKIFIDTIYRYYLYIDTIYIYITSKEFSLETWKTLAFDEDLIVRGGQHSDLALAVIVAS